ncbi:arginine kinase 1-like [Eupeodes corollae]|uniref:arginine kinase 1-like n=1 Tax=Eupeodes corollae TaxID=290404 RepID=UPI00249023AE|nr:arginine kinase 1-like [Eupeodes corollae]
MFFRSLKTSRLNWCMIIKRLKSNKFQIDPKVLEQLDEGYAKLKSSNSKSLLKKHLTPEIFKALRTKTTKSSTLLDCIQSGLVNHDSLCGVYAPDAEAYKVFSALFDPIIEEYHCGFKKTDKHPCSNFGNPCVFGDLDPFKNYIASTRIRCARSIKGYPFLPRMSKQDYDDVEDIIHCTLSGMDMEYKGVVHYLYGMKKSIRSKLTKDHLLYKPDDRFLKAANGCRFYPTGRSLYHNFDKTFLVWPNEKDHLRMISMQRGGNLTEVFSRLVRALNAMEGKIPFEHDYHLGYLTFCPTDLGSTIRASVHIRLPKLSSNKKKLEEIVKKYKLQIRGTNGEHTDVEDGIYDISNKRRLGLTEYQIVRGFGKAISEIIRQEKAAKGNTISERKTSDKKVQIKKGNKQKS